MVKADVSLELCGEVKSLLMDLGHEPPFEATLAGAAGSGRHYWRIGERPHSHIVLASHEGDADYDRFLHVSRALRSAGLRVPEIHGHQDIQRQVVLEDLGSSLHLDRMHRREGKPQEQEELCREVVLALAQWQEKGTAAIPTCTWLGDRHFDHDALRWETDYFLRRYLGDVCGLGEAPSHDPALIREFEALASRVAAHEQVLMHRDFQSQNLMWRGNDVWFIDYQGCRWGSQWYDLGSFLWDPYVQLPAAMRLRLFEQFAKVRGIDPDTGWLPFLEASLQRLMQALGAYGFLSRHKGLPWFSQYLEPGRALLEQAISAHGGFPVLRSWLRQGTAE
ncbi:MAG: hypothetical protein RL318_945 [Fibrobacterota bacterium]|jgi:aminoglycoside/choline kinase family phosphotransferase